MKKNFILAASVAAFAFTATPVWADVEIRIVGASAFRQATLDTIKSLFDSEVAPNPNPALAKGYSYAHDKAPGDYKSSKRSVWRGNFPGVDGITTIRCTFTGSVEGIRAIAVTDGTYDETFLANSTLAVSGENANATTQTGKLPAKFAFSDVYQTSTPIVSPVLNPADARVGVVTFTPLANESAPAGLNNLTSQQARALFTAGLQPLSIFTGVSGEVDEDNYNYVVAIGRSDSSGTRTTFLAEIGYGITNLVQQYIATENSGTDQVTDVRLTWANGPYSSTVWGYDLEGNGGYESGGDLRAAFGRKTDSVTLTSADGTQTFPIGKAYLVTFLSTGDARSAMSGGAKQLAFNGVKIDASNLPLSAADQAKVVNGSYTAWGYEHLYYNGSLSTDEGSVYQAIKDSIPSYISTSGNGIPFDSMAVSRADDGGTVAPIF